MKLSKKQQAFIENYLQSWNATQAAKAAGYKHPRHQASRLLSYVNIQEAIQNRLNELAMSADEVLKRLADQARGSVVDFLKFDSSGVKLDLTKGKEKLHLVERLQIKNDGSITIEMYSAQAALKLLGEHHKLFTQKHEHSVELEPLPDVLQKMVDKVYSG